jgi:hypothetical protein
MTAVWVAIGALAALAIAEAVAIVALAREIGLMTLRLPPVPALESGDGPPIGGRLPSSAAIELGSGRHIALDGPSERSRVLVLLSTTCSECRVVLRDLAAVEADWPSHDFIPVVSGPEEPVLAMSLQSGYPGAVFRDDGDTMRALGVGVTPTALVLDREGIVTAQGVVNSREMVTSLLTGHVRVNHQLVDHALTEARVSRGGGGGGGGV